MDGVTQAEWDEYWSTVEALVASNGIQGLDEVVHVDETEEELEPAPTRTRDTSLGPQPSSKRVRDRQLPRRRGTP
jgi:hypothetical protein